ncbi:TPA: hypothetical protein KOB88_002515 [Clostridioides difficile]|nr:hypothetical protein [Clostridioides difficile]
MIKRKLRKFLALGLLGILTSSTLIGVNNIDSYAHNTYFISVTLDESSYNYVPNVIFEQNSWSANKHAEADLGNFTTVSEQSNSDIKSKNLKVPILKYEGIKDEQVKESYDSAMKVKENDEGTKEDDATRGSGDGSKSLIFTFPALHGKGLLVDSVNANAEDEKRADLVADVLIGGLNNALNFCLSSTEGNFTIEQIKAFSANLANKAVNKSGSVSLGEVSFTISSASEKDLKKLMDGTTIKDYIKITSPNNGSIIVPMQIFKGYVASGSREPERKLNSDYYKQLKEGGDVKYLNWKHVVLQGNYNADVKKITFSNENEISKPNQLTIMVGDFLNGMLSGLRRLLGLYPMEDLMLNTGVRDNNYYYGIMPNGWMSSATLLNIVCQIVAWNLIGFSIVRMLLKRQLATINISEKLSLMEGFKNLIITAFLLCTFTLIFQGFLKVNYELVDMFGKSSSFSSYIGTTHTMNSGLIATILINIAFFVINIYFNFFYVLRAVTIALLYAVAPLCIFSLSLGGKYVQIFSNFMKELVSQIFIQTFHAILVAFFTSVTSTQKMKTFELFVVFCSFIPLTNFLRSNILGLPSGITDQAERISGMGRAIVGGAVAGVVGESVGGKGKAGGVVDNEMIGMGINSRPSSFSSALKDKYINGSSSYNGIDNKDLLSGIEDSNKSNYATQVYGEKNSFDKAVDTAKTVGSIGKSVGKAVGTAGLSMGYGVIGDNRGMERIGAGMASATSSIRNSLGGNSPDLSGFGISSIYDNGESNTAVYDAQIGEHGVKFNNSSIDDSTYGRNLNEMYNVFNSNGEYSDDKEKGYLRDSAKQYYQSQGIIGVGTVSGDNGEKQMAVNFDKSMVSKNRNFSLRDIGEIKPYEPMAKSANLKKDIK